MRTPRRSTFRFVSCVAALVTVAVLTLALLEKPILKLVPTGSLKRFLYDRTRNGTRSKETQAVIGNSKQRGSAGYSTRPLAEQRNWNCSQYSLPHNTTVHGRPFHMDQSIVNILQNILTNETFKREPVKLDSVESFPEIVFVTGASSNHFGEFKGHLQSFLTNFPRNKLMFYDLGLKTSEATEISKESRIEYRKFDFSRYPAHVKNLHNYAWKPLIIQQLLAEFDGVLWFDSSIRFKRNMTHLKERMVRYKSGFQYYVGATRHSIVSATHPRMIEYFPMERSGAVENMPEANSVIVLNTAEVQNNIMKWMCVCVLNEDCISPPGSKLFCNFYFPREKFGGCHRYDQSLFSIVVSNAYSYERVRFIVDSGESLGSVQRG